MLSRFVSKPSHFHRFLKTLITSQTHLINPNKPISQNSLLPNHHFFPKIPHFSLYSTRGGNGSSSDSDSTTRLWKLSSGADRDSDDGVFSDVPGDHEGEFDGVGGDVGEGDVSFSGAKQGHEDYKPWSFADKGEKSGEEEEDMFRVDDFGKGKVEPRSLADYEEPEEKYRSERKKEIEAEEKELVEIIKGPNRAFGDLIASSGITDEMLDSLIALKDFEGIQGLPPLSEIEDRRYEKNTRKSSRAEIERQKLEEAAKARVRQVDEKGRAYGTGRRKCSSARVWIQPGKGKFLVNDKEFDVYFPMLDHRAALLRPFSETKTLGMWDVNCTVKGGGTSGQVGAIRLGISRALQNWEPGLRPPLKEAGFLTRDSRVVERKKPGKAKARKSFQWVKR